jgi:fructoselysine-6-P-deglycase FrlB-like protein
VTGISPELFGDGAYRIFKEVDRVLILACGTSLYSGMTAKYWLESIAGIPTNVEIASEYRYRDSVPDPKTLVVTITQSGETADTLAALKHARSLGMKHTLTICNVSTSAMVRECELAYITRAGVEIGVASTKAFTTQLAGLYLLTLALAQVRGRLSDEQEAEELKALRHLPVALQAVLALEPQVIAWSEDFARKENALFLGRGLHYPIALEGALKLKEISYIHAEAYPAGELKHGPLALVTDQMPVVTVAPNDTLLEKLKSNMQEVRARGGQLYVFADDDTRINSEPGVHVIRMPEHYGALSPILHVVPLQLLAYHTACCARDGCGQTQKPGQDDALDPVPVVGRQVDEPEQQGRDQPGADDRGPASETEASGQQRQQGEEGQQGDHLLAEQLRDGLGEEGDAPRGIHTTQLRRGRVGRDVSKGADDGADAHADDDVQQREADHQPQFAPAHLAEDGCPVTRRDPRQRHQRNQREQHGRDHGPQWACGPWDGRHQHGKAGHHGRHDEQPLPPRQAHRRAVVEGEVGTRVFQPAQPLGRRQGAWGVQGHGAGPSVGMGGVTSAAPGNRRR